MLQSTWSLEDGSGFHEVAGQTPSQRAYKYKLNIQSMSFSLEILPSVILLLVNLLITNEHGID